MLVGDILPRNAHHAPDRTAVVCDGRAWSFAEHAARAYRLANALAGAGLTRQDRISIIAHNSAAFLEVFAAGEVSGLIVNPVNARLTKGEVAYILGDAEPGAVFFEPAYTDMMTELHRSLPGVRQFVRLDGDGAPPAWCVDYEDFLAAGAPARPDQQPQPDDTAYLFYTSGSTGRPKGVMLGQRAQWQTALSVSYDLTIAQTDSWLLVMPLFHVGAKYIQNAHHLAGAAIHVQRRFDAAAAVAEIEDARLTIAHFAPTMLQAILDLPDIAGRDLTSLHTVTYGSAPMPVPLLRRALARFGPIFMERYGATESAAVTALYKHQHVLDGDARDAARLASCGQANLFTELRCLRPDGSVCEAGEPGELLIRNPDLVMQGYWRNEAATAAVLKDGWYHSGDIAVIDGEGFLTIIDRKTDMIISGGENIYPREVEEALLHHPGVAHAAVIGIPDDRWGESVLAYVTRAPGAEHVGADELIAFCRTRIASYKKPSRVEFRDDLPRLGTGKIDKETLRLPFWQGRDRRV